MWWYRRGNSGGSWLPEEKKANMWDGRENSGGSWPPAIPSSPFKFYQKTPSNPQFIEWCSQFITINGIFFFFKF